MFKLISRVFKVCVCVCVGDILITSLWSCKKKRNVCNGPVKLVRLSSHLQLFFLVLPGGAEVRIDSFSHVSCNM